ncbi:MAG: YaaA family protein, partial [Microbacteriaceae bacterium]
RLGPGQRFEIERNRSLTTSPSMPAIDRYSGVLYDALDSATLSEEDRIFASGRLAVHSALFGLIGAADRIPAYRLSHDSRLPGVSLRRTWCGPVSAVLTAHPGIIIDLRSESYAALGPIPGRPDAVAVRVVAEDSDGRRRALSHFNKKTKGVFARAMIQAGLVHTEVESLLDWAAASGFRLSPAGPGFLELVVDDAVAKMSPDGTGSPIGALRQESASRRVTEERG